MADDKSINQIIFCTGIRTRKRPCFYHILIHTLLASFYRVNVKYFYNKKKLNLGITEEQITQIQLINNISTIYKKLMNMNSDADIAKFYIDTDAELANFYRS